MKKQRLAVRIFAGLVTTGLLAMGAVTAPAQADTGWNRRISPVDTTVKIQPGKVAVTLDTGWN